jgi:hypothetical protein
MQPQTYHSRRYVRQDSVDWDLLHAGTVTGSTILGATGLCHEAAGASIARWPSYLVRTPSPVPCGCVACWSCMASMLQGGTSIAGQPSSAAFISNSARVQRSEALLAAFRRLSQPPDSRLYASRAEADAATAQNDAAMRAYNGAKPAIAGAAISAIASPLQPPPPQVSTGGQDASEAPSKPFLARPEPVPSRLSVLVNGVRRQLLLKPMAPPSAAAAAADDAADEHAAAADRAVNMPAHSASYHMEPVHAPEAAAAESTDSDSTGSGSDASSAGDISHESGSFGSQDVKLSDAVDRMLASSGVSMPLGTAVTSAIVPGPRHERIIVYSIRSSPHAAGTITDLPADPDVTPHVVGKTTLGANKFASAVASLSSKAREWLPPEVTNAGKPNVSRSARVHKAAKQRKTAARSKPAEELERVPTGKGPLLMPVLQHSPSEILSAHLSTFLPRLVRFARSIYL